MKFSDDLLEGCFVTPSGAIEISKPFQSYSLTLFFKTLRYELVL